MLVLSHGLDEDFFSAGATAHMEVDTPSPKRRRLGMHDFFEPQPTDSALWGLCDALAHYANDPQTPLSSLARSVPRSPLHQTSAGSSAHGGRGFAMMSGGSSGSRSSCGGQASSSGSGSCAEVLEKLNTLALSRDAAAAFGGAGSSRPYQAQATASPASPPANRPPAPVSSSEPLLRTLTQMANAAAASAAARRVLVTECQVQAPLLRLMQQLPWSRQPVVMERSCRLLHWLCARTPENRAVLAAHRAACETSVGCRSVSFVDAVLETAETHSQCREVLAHALRALAALLPSPLVREELARTQPRLITCLVSAGELLDVAAVKAVCRWLPGMAGQLNESLTGRQRWRLKDRSEGQLNPRLANHSFNAMGDLPQAPCMPPAVAQAATWLMDSDADVQMTDAHC
eukprot:TRINITY_DN39522_c0_g2_i1.p1 TRINITY_DN39522_c0_g2~~TRINITY_DN39522_c0_g2_i1.p1  ORF type:complete len:402 (+),score=88.24 TRINITY_DN39522_c0_g2_i1:50-1255(+)